MTDHAGERRRSTAATSETLLLTAFFLAGLAMRAQLVAIGPLLPSLRVDLGMSYAVGGLLVTLPVLCMGLVAIPASVIAGRFGAATAMVGCLAVLAIDGLLRAAAPDAATVLLLTIPIGIAIGLGGALLPVVAKERFPRLPARSTGAYVTGFVLGSALSSALAAPLAERLGSWRWPLAVFAIVTVAPTIGWWLATRGGPRHVPRPDRLPRPPWRRSIAWLLVTIFGLQSLLFFGLATWLPAVYVERGMAQAEAGLLVGIFIAVGLPVTVIASWTGERRGSRRRYLASGAALTLAALAGIAVAPDPAVLWALLAGIGLGILFPLSLMLPLDVSADPSQVAGYIGLMLGVGYILSATAPFALGALRDVVGSFTASLWILSGVALVSLVAALVAGPERLARERRRGDQASRLASASGPILS